MRRLYHNDTTGVRKRTLFLKGNQPPPKTWGCVPAITATPRTSVFDWAFPQKMRTFLANVRHQKSDRQRMEAKQIQQMPFFHQVISCPVFKKDETGKHAICSLHRYAISSHIYALSAFSMQGLCNLATRHSPGNGKVLPWKQHSTPKQVTCFHPESNLILPWKQQEP